VNGYQPVERPSATNTYNPIPIDDRRSDTKNQILPTSSYDVGIPSALAKLPRRVPPEPPGRSADVNPVRHTHETLEQKEKSEATEPFIKYSGSLSNPLSPPPDIEIPPRYDRAGGLRDQGRGAHSGIEAVGLHSGPSSSRLPGLQGILRAPTYEEKIMVEYDERPRTDRNDGLEVHDDFEKEIFVIPPDSPEPIKVNPTQIEPDVWSHTQGSGASSSRAGVFGRFFNRRNSARASIPKVSESLEFTFSGCGTRVILWDKGDATRVVVIPTPFNRGDVVELSKGGSSRIAEANAPGSKICHLAANRNTIACIVAVGKVRPHHLDSKTDTDFCRLDIFTC
jgi:hypothetical protein